MYLEEETKVKVVKREIDVGFFLFSEFCFEALEVKTEDIGEGQESVGFLSEDIGFALVAKKAIRKNLKQ